jgi:hypothetical protein
MACPACIMVSTSALRHIRPMVWSPCIMGRGYGRIATSTPSPAVVSAIVYVSTTSIRHHNRPMVRPVRMDYVHTSIPRHRLSIGRPPYSQVDCRVTTTHACMRARVPAYCTYCTCLPTVPVCMHAWLLACTADTYNCANCCCVMYTVPVLPFSTMCRVPAWLSSRAWLSYIAQWINTCIS